MTNEKRKRTDMEEKKVCHGGHEAAASAKKAAITAEDERFMQMAIDLSVRNVAEDGGPFGAVIVRNGEVIATGVNRVTASCDPTAHAEVSAIRAACAKLKNFKLEGCTVYTSCEPCPMCLSALYWAGVDKIYYGNTKEDAKAIDFDDSFIYDEIAKEYGDRRIPCINIMREQALKAFRDWDEKTDKIKY